jgi:nucleoside-diphosphate-sugar epimerase
VEGTKKVLQAARETAGIKRVVMTSLTAAIFKINVEKGHCYTEADWNDVEE